jgi:hypothetical protein
MVATLYPCMPDVANDLVQLLKGDFRWHVCTTEGYLNLLFWQNGRTYFFS